MLSLSAPARRLAGWAAALSLTVGGSGCAALLPSRFVRTRTPPPEAVAREAAAAPAPPAEARAAEVSPQPPPPPAAPRSLADLVDLALSRDPSTRAVWHDARAAAAQAGARRSLFLPSVDASVTAGRAQSAPSTNRRATQTTATGSATITWLLLDLGGRAALVDEADRLLAAARLAEHSAVADLLLRVEETYFQLLAARALVDAQSASVRQAEASLAAAEGRQRAGLATVSDVLSARTELARTRLTLQQLEGQSLQLRGALATLAGLRVTSDLDVGALPARVDAAAADPTVEDLVVQAAARNPDLGRARALADAADARARAASRAGWPTLGLQASAGRSYVLSDVAATQADQYSTWSAGLVLRLPVFEGLRPAYDALAARASADAARARADATLQRVELDVWTSFQGLRTSGRRVDTARTLVESATASAEVAAGRYAEGVGSILDLLNAQAALELARAEDVRARADYLVSLARLGRATGRLDLPPPRADATVPEGPRTP